MRTHSLRIFAPAFSIVALVLSFTPVAASTMQQATGRRSTPAWVWLLILAAIVLLAWWLWNSSRHKAEQKKEHAAQPKLPESIGEAVAQSAETPSASKSVAESAPQPPAVKAEPSAAPAAAAPSQPVESVEVVEEEVVVETIVVEPPAATDSAAPGKETPASTITASESPAAPVTAAPAAEQRSAPAVDAFARTPKEAAAEAEPATKSKRKKSTKKAGEDLTVIEGIGPKISTILQEAGITSYAMLAAMPVDDLRKLLADNNLRFANPSTWPEQAALAADDPGKLEELKATLKGGRRQ